MKFRVFASHFIALMIVASPIPFFLSGFDICELNILRDKCEHPHEAQRLNEKPIRLQTEKREFHSITGEDIEITRFEDINVLSKAKASPDGSIFVGAGAWATVVRLKSGASDWFATRLDKELHIIRDFEFLNNNKAIAIGDAGQIYHSGNDGDSWELYNPGFLGGFNPSLKGLEFETAYTIAFANDHYGLIGGTGRLLRTNNGGRTWSSINIDKDLVFQKIILKDDYTGWATTTKGLLYTKNGGNTWETLAPANNPIFRFRDRSPILALDYVDNSLLCFSDAYDIFCSGGLSPFWRANVEWTKKPHDGSLGVTSIKMLNKNQGWFSTDKGEIYLTEDGAQNWKLWADVQDYVRHEYVNSKDRSYEVQLGSIGDGGEKIYATGNVEVLNKIGNETIFTGWCFILSWKKPPFR